MISKCLFYSFFIMSASFVTTMQLDDNHSFRWVMISDKKKWWGWWLYRFFPKPYGVVKIQNISVKTRCLISPLTLTAHNFFIYLKSPVVSEINVDIWGHLISTWDFSNMEVFQKYTWGKCSPYLLASQLSTLVHSISIITVLTLQRHLYPVRPIQQNLTP